MLRKMQQACGKDKLILTERKLLKKYTFLWIFLCSKMKNINLDYRYNFQSSYPEYGEVYSQKKVNYIVLVYNMHI